MTQTPDQPTGDLVIDAALDELRAVPTDDPDAQLEVAARVRQTLHARLSDLGGE